MIAEAKALKTKNINLLPPELRYGFFKRVLPYVESHPKEFAVRTAAILISIMLTVSIYQGHMAKRYLRKGVALESEINKLQAEHKEAEGIMNQVDQARQILGFQTSLIEKRIGFLKSQYRFGHHWGTTLRELMRIVPEGVWLEGINTEGGQLQIKGGAFSEELVGDFMTVLRSSPAFSNISFNYTQNSRVGQTEVIIFELTCNYSLQYIRES